MEQENNSNNHHSIIEYKGQWLLFYHRWLDIDSECGRQRHVAAEYLFFNEDGTIKPIERTSDGISDFQERTDITIKSK